MDKSVLIYRERNETDNAFILNSWTKEVAQKIPWKYVGRITYNNGQYPIHTNVLEKAKCLLAVHTDDPTSIFGYVVYEFVATEIIIHFVYVKQYARKLGIATDLIQLVFPDFGKRAAIITQLPRHESERPPIGDFLSDHLLHYDPYVLDRRQ